MLTVLPRLDNLRKRSILQFLYESNLIVRDKPIVDLNGADWSHANLHRANLREASFWMSYLDYADLSHTDLQKADLRGSLLKGADLSFANLFIADLSDADMTGVRAFLLKNWRRKQGRLKAQPCEMGQNIPSKVGRA